MNRWKPVVRYYLRDYRNTILVYYLVMVILALFANFSISLSNGRIEANINGIEFASAILFFVLGCCSFHEYFRFFTQNSVSRLSQFRGTLLIAVLSGLFCAAADQLYSRVVGLLMPTSSLYGMLYHGGVLPWQETPVAILWSLSVNLACFSLGYCIAVLYYRMNKIQKIAASIGVPLLCIVVLPLVNSVYLDYMLSRALAQVLLFLGGFLIGPPSPLLSAAAILFVACIPLACAWLLQRRAPLKSA